MSYAGVEFDTNEIQVICTAWMTVNEKKVHWPPFKTQHQYNNSLKTKLACDQTWTQYNIKKVLFYTDDLAKAHAKIKKAEETSDLATESEDLPEKRQRKPTKKLYESEEEEINYEDELQMYKNINSSIMRTDKELNENQEINKLKKQIEELELENKNLRYLNQEIQHKILDYWNDFSMKSKEKSNEIITFPDVGARTGDQTHLGRDIWIPNQIFDSIFAKSKTSSMFVRELSESVFGANVLAKSSVTGRSANKTGGAARPALDGTKLMAIKDALSYKLRLKGASQPTIDKECSLVNAIISQKIVDLNRPSRKVLRQDDLRDNTPLEDEEEEN